MTRLRLSPDHALAGLARVVWLLSLPFVRFDVEGGSMNERVGAAIIVANHRSLFDVAAGLVVFHRYRRYPRVLIEKKYVDSSWTRPFARMIGAIPVDRSTGRGEAFTAAVRELQAGRSVLVLPEGRLHWDTADPLSTGRASTGVSRLAEASGAPIIAAGLVGTERVWPAGRPLPYLNPFRRRRPISVRIIDQELYLDGNDQRARTEVVMSEVRRLMGDATTAERSSGWNS